MCPEFAIFKQLFIDMDAKHNMFIFYTNFLWLSEEFVTKQVFEPRDKLTYFFEGYKKTEYCNIGLMTRTGLHVLHI